MIESYAYFPANIYREERPDLIETVFQNCLEALEPFRSEDSAVHQSCRLASNAEFQEISNYLLVSSVGILRSQGYDVDKYDFTLSGLWAQEICHGGEMNTHIHKNSQICGWLFLETPVDGSYPVYNDCRSNKSMIELDYTASDDVTNATNAIHFNNIVPGTVLFSNSWLQHQLTKNKSQFPTRCIHFIVSHKERACNIC